MCELNVNVLLLIRLSNKMIYNKLEDKFLSVKKIRCYIPDQSKKVNEIKYKVRLQLVRVR